MVKGQYNQTCGEAMLSPSPNEEFILQKQHLVEREGEIHESETGIETSSKRERQSKREIETFRENEKEREV